MSKELMVFWLIKWDLEKRFKRYPYWLISVIRRMNGVHSWFVLQPQLFIVGYSKLKSSALLCKLCLTGGVSLRERLLDNISVQNQWVSAIQFFIYWSRLISQPYQTRSIYSALNGSTSFLIKLRQLKIFSQFDGRLYLITILEIDCS